MLAAPMRLAMIRSCAVGVRRAASVRGWNTYVVLREFVLHTFCIMHGTSGDFTFGYQNDGTVLGFTETVVDEFFQLVYFGIELRMMAASAPEAMAPFRPGSRRHDP